MNTTLTEMNACPEAVEWVGDMSLRQAWRRCKRGDWMLWLAVRRGVDRKEIVWVACQCARLALKHVPEGEERSRLAVETAEAWTRGEVSDQEVRRAADATYAAAYADAAPYAADAATYAAAAAYAATYAAAAPYAADAAADAAFADAATYAATREKVLAECATICRRQWSTLPGGMK